MSVIDTWRFFSPGHLEKEKIVLRKTQLVVSLDSDLAALLRGEGKRKEKQMIDVGAEFERMMYERRRGVVALMDDTCKREDSGEDPQWCDVRQAISDTARLMGVNAYQVWCEEPQRDFNIPGWDLIGGM